MTTIVNILATSNIEEDFTRQPIEFYLTHKVLEHPEIYKRAKKGNSYKILDCSACELHTGLDMKKVLEAAKIIKASEIILPDIVQDDTSLDVSFNAFKTLTTQELNKYKIAIVIQGSTLQSARGAVKRLCSSEYASLIDTIMIPKWFATSVRAILTREVQMRLPNKAIHWLGLGDDIAYCIHKANQLGVRSLDTGYFISAASSHIPLFAAYRDLSHKIDLEKNKLTQGDIRLITHMTNTKSFINELNSNIGIDDETGEWAKNIIKFFVIAIIVCMLALIFVVSH